MLNVALILALTLVIIASIALTSLLITRRYVSHPLQALQTSAAAIENGDLGTEIDVGGNDEVGHLAGSLSTMRDAIGDLVGQLEEVNRGLERKVEERTEELAGAKTDAEAASHAKSVFLANMSHELRTPLNAILGFSQILDRADGLKNQHRDDLRIIRRSGEHLLALINDVLEISKIEAGRTVLNEESFDLHELLYDMQEMFLVRAGEKNLDLRCTVGDDVPRHVHTDQGKLRQIVINLLGNAVKFTEAGRVELHASGQAPIRISVEDTGVGIEAADLDHLFDAFVQIGTTHSDSEGTGLGLAISQHFAKVLGTSITVHSAPGEGSSFYLDLDVPKARPEDVPARERTRKVKGLAPGQDSPRVLIVDDVEANRLILRRLFEPMEFEIREAVNGQESVEVARSWRPQLVWMDLRLPEMDGYEATRRIKAEIDNPPIVIAITASAFEEDRQRAEEAGCDDFIRKPCEEQDIVGALERHLGLRFEYEEDTPPTAAHHASEIPMELRSQLFDAASRADDEAVDALLVQLDDDLRREIGELARDFQFDRIMAMASPQ